MDLREIQAAGLIGVRASLGKREHSASYSVQAPVQADKTGQSVAALIQNFHDFLGSKGVTEAELERTVNNGVRELPGAFETNKSVMEAMAANDFFGRPDDYYESLPAKYQSLSQASLDQAARGAIDPAKFLWVIVGDARQGEAAA